MEPDRRLAIEACDGRGSGGDVVLILGKGHESGQEFATETLPFDDRLVALETLLALSTADAVCAAQRALEAGTSVIGSLLRRRVDDPSIRRRGRARSGARAVGGTGHRR